MTTPPATHFPGRNRLSACGVRHGLQTINVERVNCSRCKKTYPFRDALRAYKKGMAMKDTNL